MSLKKKYTLPKQSLEYLVHQLLEGSRRICQPKWQDKPFTVTSSSKVDLCLSSGLLLHDNLLYIIVKYLNEMNVYY